MHARGETQLIATLEASYKRRVLCDAKQICGVMTSHLNIPNPPYNNKKIKICWVWSCSLTSIIFIFIIEVRVYLHIKPVYIWSILSAGKCNN